MTATLLAWLQAALPWLPAGLWCAWWLLCIPWKKAWPILAAGGWLPVVLLTVVVALVWSRLFPATWGVLGWPMPNFWWQLTACSALTLIALFCGWLQGQLGWTPPEVSYDPPAAPAQSGH
jgi:hypothetical protein